MSTAEVDKEIADMGFHRTEGEEETQEDDVIKPFWRSSEEPVSVLMVDQDSGQVKEVRRKKAKPGRGQQKKGGRRRRKRAKVKEENESDDELHSSVVLKSESDGQEDDLFDDIEDQLTLTAAAAATDDNTGSYEMRLTLKAKYQARIEKQKLVVRQKNAEIKRLQALVKRHQQMEKKWARQSQARESRDKKARKCISKQGKLDTIKEFLVKDMKYTDNQVDLLTSDKKIRPKEWPIDEMLESLYQYDLGRELYGYLYKHLADKIPMPSVTALLRYKNSNPETFICTVRECKRTLYSQDQFNRHMAVHGANLCEQCGKGFGTKVMLRKHLMAVHFQHKPHRCKLCGRDFAKMENLEIHLAVTHLKLCPNDKAFRENRAQFKPQVQPYKELIPFKLIDSQTGVIGTENDTELQEAIIHPET